jgi:hypothetical protein
MDDVSGFYHSLINLDISSTHLQYRCMSDGDNKEIGGIRLEAANTSLKTSLDSLFGAQYQYKLHENYKAIPNCNPEELKSKTQQALSTGLEVVRAGKEAYGLPASHLKPKEFLQENKKLTQLDFDKQEIRLQKALEVINGNSTHTDTLNSVIGELGNSYIANLALERAAQIQNSPRQPFLIFFSTEDPNEINKIETEYNARENVVKEVVTQITQKSPEWAQK